MEAAAAVHMIGIGGIGISALAQFYVHEGYRVTGTNDNPSPETLDRVRALGVDISQDLSASTLPKDIDFFVYSDSWLTMEPEFMKEVEGLGKPMLSYFEALGDATQKGTSIVVAGTHGKTTTTAMIARTLIELGKQPTVFAGSILSEYGSNFIKGRDDLFVIEGCEYRRHFLHLHPNILVVTNIELDHTDYYKDEADMANAFNEVAMRVPASGRIVTNTDSSTIKPILHTLAAPVVPYQHTTVPQLRVPGVFNNENAQAAKAAAYALDPDLHEQDIDNALADFKGTWRRFEYRGVTPGGAKVYDDYAHHPTAVESTLHMVREEFPNKKIVVLFHPHLYSRTKQFFDDFAKTLSIADNTYVLPVFAAREPFDASFDSTKLAEAVNIAGGRGQSVETFEGAHDLLCSLTDDTLIITMGAGDVYKVADMLVRNV